MSKKDFINFCMFSVTQHKINQVSIEYKDCKKIDKSKEKTVDKAQK